MNFPLREGKIAGPMGPPRAEGTVFLSSKCRDGRGALDRFRTSGCMKALFPRSVGALSAILINSSGGLTGGDALQVEATAGAGSRMVLTTQAAERAYRAADGVARVDSRLRVEAGATLHWLPQELILFEGAALRRSLSADLAPDARLLMVEPVIFGRTAMGEVLRAASFHDRIEIRRDGAPLYCDGLRLDGDLHAQLRRPAVANGAGAMASVVFAAPEADAELDAIRRLLPDSGGASLLRSGLLAVRLLAEDGFALRTALLPILDRLSKNTLPTSWRL